jgi:hypothetical protein
MIGDSRAALSQRQVLEYGLAASDHGHRSLQLIAVAFSKDQPPRVSRLFSFWTEGR